MSSKENNKKGKLKSPKASQILSLPRELRHMIYRKLVSPDRADRTRMSYKIKPSILRVNKHKHKEASGV